MNIQCATLSELAKVCAQLVREGVLFDAHTATLEITMTGGY